MINITSECFYYNIICVIETLLDQEIKLSNKIDNDEKKSVCGDNLSDYFGYNIEYIDDVGDQFDRQRMINIISKSNLERILK